jgi:hypothetical protein
MAMNLRPLSFGVCVLLAGCSSSHAVIEDILISGFHSDEPERCRPSDVALDERQVASFFNRAEPIDGRTLHDQFDWAPCYLEGTLKYQGNACIWRVRAGATGEVECSASAQYFGCKDCENLFKALKQ